MTYITCNSVLKGKYGVIFDLRKIHIVYTASCVLRFFTGVLMNLLCMLAHLVQVVHPLILCAYIIVPGKCIMSMKQFLIP